MRDAISRKRTIRAAGLMVVFLGVSAEIFFASCAPRSRVQRKTAPAITAVRISPEHQPDVATPAFGGTVEGVGLPVGSTDLVQLELRNQEGGRVDARFISIPTIGAVALGAGTFTLHSLNLAPGKYQVCAALSKMTPVCAQIWLQQQDPRKRTCRDKFLVAMQANPKFGCRCERGEIRLGNTRPDGHLGQFVQGNLPLGSNMTGPYARGSVKGARLTSTFKFEAHFEVQAVNDPGRPQECSEIEWAALTYSHLCPELQLKNETIVRNEGLPGETVAHASSGGTVAPYDSGANAALLTDGDGYGYQYPVRLNDENVRGWIKAYEPGIVHWIDGPGISFQPGQDFAGDEPMHQDISFLSYVHGSSGLDQDNCDCRFAIRSAIIDANGRAREPQVLKQPECL